MEVSDLHRLWLVLTFKFLHKCICATCIRNVQLHIWKCTHLYISFSFIILYYHIKPYIRKDFSAWTPKHLKINCDWLECYWLVVGAVLVHLHSGAEQYSASIYLSQYWSSDAQISPLTNDSCAVSIVNSQRSAFSGSLEDSRCTYNPKHPVTYFVLNDLSFLENNMNVTCV